MRRILARARDLAAGAAGFLALVAAKLIFGFARLIGPRAAPAAAGAFTRALGPLLPVHRIALENLRASFPERSEEERRAIARDAWENLGRVGGEYAHLSKLLDPERGVEAVDARVEVDGAEHFLALRDDGRPGIVFTGHFANWEIPAIVAERHGLEVTAVYRAPNDPVSRRIVEEIRRETMGETLASRPGVAFALAEALSEGAHLGMLIDQHHSAGVTTPFFGRPALTNPVLAKLARHYDCPVHGVRTIRLPEGRFRVELTPPLDLPRDRRGRIEEVGAMRMMTAVIEGWVRENPGQWLWMHRRWRPPHQGRQGRRARATA